MAKSTGWANRCWLTGFIQQNRLFLWCGFSPLEAQLPPGTRHRIQLPLQGSTEQQLSTMAMKPSWKSNSYDKNETHYWEKKTSDETPQNKDYVCEILLVLQGMTLFQGCSELFGWYVRLVDGAKTSFVGFCINILIFNQNAASALEVGSM